MKRFCEIILKSGHWPRGGDGVFSSGGHFVQQSETILPHFGRV